MKVIYFAIFLFILTFNSFAELVDEANVEMIKESITETSTKTIRETVAKTPAEKVGKEIPIKAHIDTETESALKKRIAEEKQSNNLSFSMTPYKQNYILPFTYNSSPNNAPFIDTDFQSYEVKFQLSTKFQISENFWRKRFGLFFGYTQKSHWQLGYREYSHPFRDTNHEPEFVLTFKTHKILRKYFNSITWLAINHQSNGRSGSLSRSWNRIYLNTFFYFRKTLFSLKVWHRLKENPEGDENPQIVKFAGNFELTGVQKIGTHTLSLMIRNNLESENKGSIEVGYSFPVAKKLRGYVQYFNGYYETLIDYDAYSNRIGLGLMLNDWL